MQHCPVCLCPSGPPPPISSLGSTKIWTHARKGLAALLQEESGPLVSPRVLQGGGAGLTTVAWASSSPWLPSCQEVSPSGGDPGQEAAAGGCVPQPPSLRKAGQKTLHSPSSWWVPSPAHRRGSGETSPSSPEPRKSNSLMASSESSSSSSSSISGTRALDGSWDTGKTRQVRGSGQEPKHTRSLQTEKSGFHLEPFYTGHELPPQAPHFGGCAPPAGSLRKLHFTRAGWCQPRAWVWRPQPPHLQL